MANPWSKVERHAGRRAARCQAVYDQADALRKLSAKSPEIQCDTKAVSKAVKNAFMGPCKKANRDLLRAFATCRRTGIGPNLTGPRRRKKRGRR
jgi:hypothetical protein